MDNVRRAEKCRGERCKPEGEQPQRRENIAEVKQEQQDQSCRSGGKAAVISYFFHFLEYLNAECPTGSLDCPDGFLIYKQNSLYHIILYIAICEVTNIKASSGKKLGKTTQKCVKTRRKLHKNIKMSLNSLFSS